MRSSGLVELCVALCALAGAGCKKPEPPPPPPPAAAAVVNGKPIPLAVLQREVDRLRRGASGEAPAPSTKAEDVPKLAHALLGPLIDRELLVERAREAGLSVSDAEVQREIDQLASASGSGGFEERLKRDGQTPDGLAEEIRERLMAEKWVAAQTRGPERISDAELHAWYDAHRAELDKPEQVHALQIVVSSAEEAKSLLDQLRAGASFEELAKKHSESPDGKRGGDLGFFSRGTMPKIFDDTCFSLKVGVPSGVVASPYGFHLFKVVEKRRAVRRSYEEAKREIVRRLTSDKRVVEERKLLEQLRASATVQVN